MEDPMRRIVVRSALSVALLLPAIPSFASDPSLLSSVQVLDPGLQFSIVSSFSSDACYAFPYKWACGPDWWSENNGLIGTDAAGNHYSVGVPVVGLNGLASTSALLLQRLPPSGQVANLAYFCLQRCR